MRQWVTSNIRDFAAQNPTMQVETELKRAQHPFIRAYYANGNDKTIGIKNLEMEEIDDYIYDLRSQIGRKMNSSGYHQTVLTETPSVQGQWHEEMDLGSVELEISHDFENK